MRRLFKPYGLPPGTSGVLLLLVCATLAMPGPLARAAADMRLLQMNDGRRGVSLRQVARHYGLDYSIENDQRHRLTSGWTDLTFEEGSRRLFAGDLLIWLHRPVTASGNDVLLDEVDLNTILAPLLRPADYLASLGHQVVVIDPGHGGRDAGALGSRGLREKDVALDLARDVRKHLVHAGYRVHLTRDDDRFLALEERTGKAAAWQADLLVSLHMNSAANDIVSGTETFLLTATGQPSSGRQQVSRPDSLGNPGNQFDAANMALAYYVHRGLRRGRPDEIDRGIKRARFQVLRAAPCPAVLVECGFISNLEDEEWFGSRKHREALAKRLAVAIMDYLAAVKRARLAHQ